MAFNGVVALFFGSIMLVGGLYSGNTGLAGLGGMAVLGGVGAVAIAVARGK